MADPAPGPGASSRWAATDAPRGAAYDAKWRAMEDAGQNIHGEVDLIERLVPVPARVLDAGCGTGRVAIELARRGYFTVGVDLDAAMLAAARDTAPGLTWVLEDLATVSLDIPDDPVGTESAGGFDAVVMAGNVIIFVERGAEGAVVENLVAQLRPGGLLIAGFSQRADRITAQAYSALAVGAGCTELACYGTWDQGPPARDYAVLVHRRNPIPG